MRERVIGEKSREGDREGMRFNRVAMEGSRQVSDNAAGVCGHRQGGNSALITAQSI